MTSAKEFIENVEGSEIVEVHILKGRPDTRCEICKFEIVMDDGYSFVC